MTGMERSPGHQYVHPTPETVAARERNNARPGTDPVDPYDHHVSLSGCERCEMLESHPAHR